ncbi:uncharacterized protein TNCV_3807971 [Trichonephila clavipes]|nr:uncharacterized protein TNCV_3807971 [Trichonephila clavipes]
MIWLDSTPILRQNILSDQGSFTSVLPPPSREDLLFEGYLEYSHPAKALYIYKHPCFLRDSNPGPTAKQPESLTTKPDVWHRRPYIHTMFLNFDYGTLLDPETNGIYTTILCSEAVTGAYLHFP